MRRTIAAGAPLALLLAAWLAGCEKNASTGPAGPEIPVPDGWRLVWNDEFNAASLDPAKWEVEVNGRGGGNNELQYYTDRADNVFFEGGALVIRALRETYTGEDGTRNYTSGRLRTKNRGDWTYGRFEIRAKLPSGRGLWPAVWMMPTDNAYGGWAASGEIDIMEELGHEPNKVYGTLHFGGAWPDNRQSGASTVLPSGTFAQDFHVFTLEWDTASFRWSVDGTVFSVKTQDAWYSTAAPRPAPFDRRFHLIMNLAVGGNWPGPPDGSTVFPQRLTVDYVRVFQRKP
jgi:beta-glucanase (GH16 family)